MRRASVLLAILPLLLFAPTASAATCVTLTHTLVLDTHDSAVGGDVTKLQQFLVNDSTVTAKPPVDGYYGITTEVAVAQWQSVHGIVSSGTPATTGYGTVGAKTRAAMSCGTQTSSTQYAAPTPPQSFSGTFSRALAQGSSGADVSALQNILKSSGYFSGQATGYFGPATAKALATFQAAHNLLAVGSVGPQTRAILNTTGSNAGAQGGAPQSITPTYTPPSIQPLTTAPITTSLSLGSQGAPVSTLQQFLKTSGFFSGSVTGYYGPATEAAVQQFQRATGVVTSGTPDTTGFGSVGAKTRAEIALLSSHGQNYSATTIIGSAPGTSPGGEGSGGGGTSYVPPSSGGGSSSGGNTGNTNSYGSGGGTGGESGSSSSNTTTNTATVTPPTPPSLTATATTSNQAFLTWVASTGGTGALTYYLYRNDIAGNCPGEC